MTLPQFAEGRLWSAGRVHLQSFLAMADFCPRSAQTLQWVFGADNGKEVAISPSALEPAATSMGSCLSSSNAAALAGGIWPERHSIGRGLRSAMLSLPRQY